MYFTHHFSAIRLSRSTLSRRSRHSIVGRRRPSNGFIYFSPQVCGSARVLDFLFYFSPSKTAQWRWSMLLYHSVRLTARPKHVAEASFHRNTQQTSHMFSNFTCYGPIHEYTIHRTYTKRRRAVRSALCIERNFLSLLFFGFVARSRTMYYMLVTSLE